MEILELDKDQQAAFNRLKRAIENCKKKNILLVNRYRYLHAYDARLMDSFGTMNFSTGNAVAALSIPDRGDYVEIPGEWADDDGEHYYFLTDKGMKLYEESND